MKTRIIKVEHWFYSLFSYYIEKGNKPISFRVNAIIANNYLERELNSHPNALNRSNSCLFLVSQIVLVVVGVVRL